MPTLRDSDARPLAREILIASGGSAEHATIVADHLVDANLAGHDSHGLVRLRQYHAQVQEGKIDPSASPGIATDAGSFVSIDGNWCWGQVGASRAVQECCQRARTAGFAVASLFRAPHIGRIGSYVLACAEQGLIAQAWCNVAGAARVAPWGGTDARLATNPIAIAIPHRKQPVLLDITTSVVAEGKVRIAKNAGRSVPLGWILDSSGAPTTNPADLYDGGTILPLGGEAFGHKGFALAMIADLLGGVLTGAGCGLMPGAEFGNGLLLMALDPARLIEPAVLDDRMDAYLDYLKQSPRKAGVEEILMPGEPETRTATQRRRDGIPVDQGTWNELIELAKNLSVPVPKANE